MVRKQYWKKLKEYSHHALVSKVIIFCNISSIYIHTLFCLQAHNFDQILNFSHLVNLNSAHYRVINDGLYHTLEKLTNKNLLIFSSVNFTNLNQVAKLISVYNFSP